jgi:hypothetical protein
MQRFLITFIFALTMSGCADTPENRQFWQQLGAGMKGAGDNLNRQAAQMRQNSATNSGGTVNCTTTNYGSGTSNTTCNRQPTVNMTCTSTNMGAGMVSTTCY